MGVPVQEVLAVSLIKAGYNPLDPSGSVHGQRCIEVASRPTQCGELTQPVEVV